MTNPGPLRVLVVEDDDNDWRFMQLAMQSARFPGNLHRVEDGGDALIYLTALPKPPDLLVLDLGLPNMSGFDLLAWMNEHPEKRAHATVVMSSSVNPADVDRSYAMGAIGYFVKPLEREPFAELARSIVTYWTFCVEALRMNSVSQR